MKKKDTIYILIIVGILFRTLTVKVLGATLSSSLIFIILISSLAFTTFSLKRNINLVYISLFCVFAVFFSHGIIEMKNVSAFFLMILVGPAIVKRATFNPNWIYKYYLFGVVPLSIVFVVFFNGTINYLPIVDRVIVCGYGTKHVNAQIGFLLTLASLYSYELSRRRSQKTKIVDVLFFILGTYIIIFSTARSYLLAFIAFVIMYLLNIRRFTTKGTFVVFVGCIVSTYFLEMLAHYSSYIQQYDWLGNIVHVDNFDTKHGVTSNRAWLWQYHISLFLNSNYLLGSGDKYVDFFKGDYLPWIGIVAPAGSESPYTRIIGCYGWIGIIMIVVHLCLFVFALIKKNVIACCVIFCAIYNTVLGDDCLSVLLGCPILVYLLYYQALLTFSAERNVNNLRISRLPHKP